MLLKLIKKHFFIVDQETLVRQHQNSQIHYLLAKHPLLKPKLIVVNDQVHGFKQRNRTLKGLEDFPITIEIDTEVDEWGNTILNSIDIYAQSIVKKEENLSDIYYLSKLYKSSVLVEHIHQFLNEDESLVIHSRLGQLLIDEDLQSDFEEGLVTTEEIEDTIENMLKQFIKFLRRLDGTLLKGKSVNRMDSLFKFSK